jgi:hypothetical protein
MEGAGSCRGLVGTGGAPDQLCGTHRRLRGCRLSPAKGRPRGPYPRPGPAQCSSRPLPSSPLPAFPSGRVDAWCLAAPEDRRCGALLVAGGRVAAGPGCPSVQASPFYACRTLPTPRSELHGRRGHAIGRGLSQHSLGPACQGRGEPSPSKRATISVRRAGSEELGNVSVESAEGIARASPRSLE